MEITEALVAEHVVFGSLFEEIERVLPKLTSVSEVKLLVGLVERLLHRHGTAENELAYLALDHVLQEKGQLVRLYQDHQEMDDHLRRAQAAKEITEARRFLMAVLKASRKHFEFEECQVFPLIERVLHRETLAKLGEIWMQEHSVPLARKTPSFPINQARTGKPLPPAAQPSS